MAATRARSEPPLVVIAGPTASGKTALAVELAEKYDGEIICADSRTIYKGMDVGTAKPTAEERARVPHWGLDLIEPGEVFSVADFKRYATAKITEIRLRGHVPIVVGGSGLYIDAVLFDFRFGGETDRGKRHKLETLSLAELHRYCVENNIILPENKNNKRYVIRAIERNSITTKRRDSPLDNSIIVGITTDSHQLHERIVLRSEQIFNDKVVEEATRLGKNYGWDSEAMTGNIYPLIRRYLNGEVSLEATKQQFAILDRRLAKRQMTWLRRNPYIEWCTRDEAFSYIESKLASEY